MNTSKPRKRQRKTCECGQTFWTTAKFGNETKCDACCKAHSDEFRAWFRAQSDEEQREMLNRLRAYAAALGVPVPNKDAPETKNDNVMLDSDVDDARQAECDDVAASLLADVEI
jgi:hypothetical protein